MYKVELRLCKLKKTEPKFHQNWQLKYSFDQIENAAYVTKWESKFTILTITQQIMLSKTLLYFVSIVTMKH